MSDDPDPVDESDFSEGSFDGLTPSELSGADDDWPRARPFQEDGHLAADEWDRKHAS